VLQNFFSQTADSSKMPINNIKEIHMTKLAPLFLLSVAVFVSVHAVASEVICTSHPMPICENPQTPPPDFAHEQSSLVANSGFISVVSTTSR
jgi:hypothetical protein